MRVVLLSYTFPRGMGYIGNMLPRYLARLGADVHYLTMDLPHYFQSEGAHSYGAFEGLDVVAPGVIEPYDGFTLHGLAHRRLLGQMAFQGLSAKLAALRPQVVQSFLAVGWPPLQAALQQRSLGFHLFTANHTTASVFPLAQRQGSRLAPAYLRNLLTRFLPGRFISARTEGCYAATVDCADVAVRFFGVESSKVTLAPLGVDTELFFPATTGEHQAERQATRSELGVADDEALLIYTGQLTGAKNPLLLARVVEQLVGEGARVRALFIGDGPQKEPIAALPHSLLRPFMPNANLPRFYRAADIGVWPTQESTSMLDAAACGLPVVVNDTLKALERIDGNGVRYRLNDASDLARVLRELLAADRGRQLGAVGARRMAAEFSWRALAAARLRDYERCVSAAAAVGRR